MQQLKPPATIDEHICLLRKRGMEVDEELASQWFANVSYYRLSGYFYSYRQLLPEPDAHGHHRSDTFLDNTSFCDVACLYEFDRKLRTLLHDGIERIEVALRTQIGQVVCAEDSLAYQKNENFRDSFNLEEWQDVASHRVSRALKHNQGIAHYHAVYGDYPFWVLAEVLDFSDLSILYSGLRSAHQHAIARGLGIDIDVEVLRRNQREKFKNNHPLGRWLEQITVVRNACAHHARLWNRTVPPASTTALRTLEQMSVLPQGQSERIFGTIMVMAYMMRSISPGSTWSSKISHLITDSYLPLRNRNLSELGFPSNWHTSTIWHPSPDN